MERRDYLEDQIKQLAQVLASMIGFIKGKKNANFESAAEAVDRALQAELDLDIESLTGLSDEHFIAKLAATNKFNSDNFERLANVLFILAKTSGADANNLKVNKLYSKSLLLYKYIESNDKNYSLHRNSRMREIQQAISM